MLRGIYTAAFGMIHNQEKQDVTANNIANAQTTGYKQDRVTATPFPEVMVQNMDGVKNGKPAVQKLGKMSFGVKSDELHTDFTQGFLEGTGIGTDFAIGGRGFFTIRYFDGVSEKEAYTRDGSFRLDSEGKLVTSSGAYVLGKDQETGNVGPIVLADGKASVDDMGNIVLEKESVDDDGNTVNSVQKFTFEISGFEDHSVLERSGGNMYTLKEDADVQPRIMEQGEYAIGQGQLERSNVDITTEMVNMITTLRSYQANQRALQSLDETLGKAVNEVGSLR